MFACLSVTSTTSESHFHKSKKKKKIKKALTLCWNTVVEAKTGTPVKSKLRSRPSLRRQQEEHNNESESQNPVTSRVFFFGCFILLGNFTSGGEPHNCFTCSLKLIMRREGRGTSQLTSARPKSSATKSTRVGARCLNWINLSQQLDRPGFSSVIWLVHLS